MARLTPALIACVRSLMVPPRDAGAYSVLAHEANIDALWDRAIVPLLERRFPQATRDEIRNARASAYGGSVIQDLGHYPFGTKFFSNLLHSAERLERLSKQQFAGVSPALATNIAAFYVVAPERTASRKAEGIRKGLAALKAAVPQ